MNINSQNYLNRYLVNGECFIKKQTKAYKGKMKRGPRCVGVRGRERWKKCNARQLADNLNVCHNDRCKTFTKSPSCHLQAAIVSEIYFDVSHFFLVFILFCISRARKRLVFTLIKRWNCKNWLKFLTLKLKLKLTIVNVAL